MLDALAFAYDNPEVMEAEEGGEEARALEEEAPSGCAPEEPPQDEAAVMAVADPVDAEPGPVDTAPPPVLEPPPLEEAPAQEAASDPPEVVETPQAPAAAPVPAPALDEVDAPVPVEEPVAPPRPALHVVPAVVAVAGEPEEEPARPQPPLQARPWQPPPKRRLPPPPPVVVVARAPVGGLASITLTENQWAELQRLLGAPQPHQGELRRQVQDILVEKGLAVLTGDRCAITTDGRARHRLGRIPQPARIQLARALRSDADEIRR